jgi:hypothetical protein
MIKQFDLPSPYGADVAFYGERVPNTATLGAFAVFIFFRFQSLPLREIGFALALSAIVATLLATPEPSRFAFPSVMAWAHFAVFLQLVCWRDGFVVPRHRLMAGVVALNQLLAFAIFVYAQTGIGLVPVPTAAFYWLHGWEGELAYALLGTLLMIWASWARPPASRGSSHV